MSVINGNVFLLQVSTGSGSKLVVGQTSNSIELTADMLDITTKDSGGNAEFLPGRKSGTIQLDFLYEVASATTGNLYANHLFDAWKNGTKCALLLGLSAQGAFAFNCYGYISSLSVEAAQNDVVSVSMSFQITAGVTLAANGAPEG